MSDITQIRARIETANVKGAGTDSWIYLGIAGREFCLDPGSGNGYFEQGAKACFVLGEQGGPDNGEGGFTNVPVADAEWNDPRMPQPPPERDTGQPPALAPYPVRRTSLPPQRHHRLTAHEGPVAPRPARGHRAPALRR
ncbi:hypothetical protein ACIBBB_33015 [Streptomyces sp. NPDC051217]|uniref:hypothetical protein n=1 Tax=Streptomyces sp. NPDC051217 TaxID=3365644 RepID=UPI0037AC6190